MYIFLVELINLAFSEIAAYIYCFLIGVAIGYYWAKLKDRNKKVEKTKKDNKFTFFTHKSK